MKIGLPMPNDGSDNSGTSKVDYSPKDMTDEPKTLTTTAPTASPLLPLPETNIGPYHPPRPRISPVCEHPPFLTRGITTIKPRFFPDIVITTAADDDRPSPFPHPPLTVQPPIDPVPVLDNGESMAESRVWTHWQEDVLGRTQENESEQAEILGNEFSVSPFFCLTVYPGTIWRRLTRAPLLHSHLPQVWDHRHD